MRSYYTGKHAVQYNQIWNAFSQKTLESAYAAIDVEALKHRTQSCQRPLRILDAACGTGLLLERLAHLFPSAQLYGIDGSREMLIQAQQLLQGSANIHLQSTRLSGDATLPFPTSFFDLITCTNALHYFQDPPAVLRSFREMLVEQGQLVLEDYQLRGFPFPWKWLEWAIRLADPEHQSLLSQQEAQRLCQQAGFHVVGAHTFSIDLFCQGWVVRART
jgi:ubiquinone/menaquinone biosynthesis C-methylase UbiE